MGRIIAIEISADAEYDITDRALKRFRRALYQEDSGSCFEDAFYRALDDWREGIGLKVNDEVEHDDPRLSITLPAPEYRQWCREVATAWRSRLAGSNENPGHRGGGQPRH